LFVIWDFKKKQAVYNDSFSPSELPIFNQTKGY
jgi:hypothetical protein